MVIKNIQVFIASYNRRDYLRECVKSVLAQSNISTIEIIVSDNSTDYNVQVMMESEFPEIRYIKREPSLSAEEHFYSIISEVSAEYYMIFHDDDMMFPEMVKYLYCEISRNNELVAVGSNSLNYDSLKNKTLHNFITIKNKTFKSKEAFLFRYLLNLPVSPFPSYIYRSSVYLKELLLKNSGKYSDLGFLLNGLDKGVIKWLKTPLMYYRQHSGNDSKTIALIDREKIIGYIVSTTRYEYKSLPIILYEMDDYVSMINKYYSFGHPNKNQEIKRISNYVLKKSHVFIFIFLPLKIYKLIVRVIINSISRKLMETKYHLPSPT